METAQRSIIERGIYGSVKIRQIISPAVDNSPGRKKLDDHPSEDVDNAAVMGIVITVPMFVPMTQSVVMVVRSLSGAHRAMRAYRDGKVTPWRLNIRKH